MAATKPWLLVSTTCVLWLILDSLNVRVITSSVKRPRHQKVLMPSSYQLVGGTPARMLMVRLFAGALMRRVTSISQTCHQWMSCLRACITPVRLLMAASIVGGSMILDSHSRLQLSLRPMWDLDAINPVQ